MNTNPNTVIYDADLYLRVSSEDGDKEESDSITNQKALILEFLKTKPEIRIHAIRIDDGYSGVHFQRPAFQQMLQEIREGTVNCIVTKDLSRFGRNHIEVGKYIEKIFPYLGVRFIAINDNYDSLRKDPQADIMIPFRNLINDAYCRDISMKTRSSLEVKRRRGEFVGAFAPYGYQKSTENKNKLEIDEEAAEIVRYIFKMYLQGKSAYRIAEILNQENISTPMDYKRSHGDAYYTGFRKKMAGSWNHKGVLRILENPIYTGALVQGKVTTPNYKVKKRINKEAVQWNWVEGKHDAIISSNDFQNVQGILRKDTRTAQNRETVYSLSGIVCCGDCGANMTRKTVPSGTKRYTYYICGNHKANKAICSSHCINAELLEKSVLKIINRQIDAVTNLKNMSETLGRIQLESGNIDRMSRKILQLQEEIKKYDRIRLEMYEDYKEGILNREEYLELKETYQKHLDSMKHTLDKFQNELLHLKEDASDGKRWMNEFLKYRDLKELTREVAVSLIDQIFIYEKREKESSPRIEVRFKFEEELEVFVNLMGRLQKENRVSKMQETNAGSDKIYFESYGEENVCREEAEKMVQSN